MGVSSRTKGWRWDRTNDRLDFYYQGTRIGHIDTGGIDLASGLEFQVNNVAVAAATLDGAYDSGAVVTVDATGGHVEFDLNDSTGDQHVQIKNTTTGTIATGLLIDTETANAGCILTDALKITTSGAGSAITDAIDASDAGITNALNIGANVIVGTTGDINLDNFDVTGSSGDIATNGILDINAATGSAIDVNAAKFVVLAASGNTTIEGTLSVTGTSTLTGNVTCSGTLTVTGTQTWNNTITVDELVLDTDGVAPGGSNAYLVRDNTNDLTINTNTGGEIHLSINNNDEYDFSATEFEIASGNDIQFLGNDGILDSAGNEILLVEAVSSATTYLNIKNANDADIELECHGGVDKGFLFKNDQNETVFELSPVATGAQHINIVGATNGASPVIQSAGTTADQGIDFENSENEELLQLVCVATAVNHVAIVNAASGSPTIASNTDDIGLIFADGSSTREEMLVLENIATAVDYVNIKSGDGTTHPAISVAGDTTNVDLLLVAKGTGNITLNNGTDPVALEFLGAQDGYNNEIQDVNGNEIVALQGVASAVCEIGLSNATTGNPAIVSARGETNSNLKLDTSGTGMITISLGGVDAMAMHDVGITLAAATDTAGHAFYMQTEDGGTDGGSASTGQAGAAWEIRTGDGSAAVTTGAVGGAGGALTLVTGAGQTGETAGNGGVGGAFGITAGAGGASGAGAGTGGTGGTITLTAGAGGGAGGGTAGAPGKIDIAAGIVHFKVQTIDMADVAVTTTLVPGTPTGTLLTGNILRVDPNSTGAGENLLLPPEADCTGIFFIIDNTAGGNENVVVQNDAGGAVGTIGQNERGYLTCDGTTWLHSTGVA